MEPGAAVLRAPSETPSWRCAWSGSRSVPFCFRATRESHLHRFGTRLPFVTPPAAAPQGERRPCGWLARSLRWLSSTDGSFTRNTVGLGLPRDPNRVRRAKTRNASPGSSGRGVDSDGSCPKAQRLVVTSSATRAAKSATDMLPRSAPPRWRTETAPERASFSPTTRMYGSRRVSASRIL